MIRDDLIKADLKRDEGYRPHVYLDSEGYETIGHGILVDKRKPGSGLTPFEAGWLLDRRVDERILDMDRAIGWWRDLPEPASRGLANMVYQLGLSGVLKFKNMLAALKAGDFAQAAEAALDSKWARQTPERAKRIAHLFQSCKE